MTTTYTSPDASGNCLRDDGAVVPIKHRLIELLWTLSPAFTRWAELHMNEPGLTPQRVRLLIELDERGPMKMSALRDALGVTATNVTALVDALEKDGMVVRNAHSTDRRAVMVTITPYAEERLEKGCGEFKNRVAELFKDFSIADQEQFAAMLTRMRGALIERGVLEPTSYCNGNATKNTAASKKKELKEKEHA